jgi:RHH-type rel operon transcriptional repressor/antitoxin RelB
MTITVRLGADIERRLESLASITGRTKTYYIKEAILEKLEDLEDIYIAEKRIEKPGKVWTMEEVERGSDMAD